MELINNHTLNYLPEIFTEAELGRLFGYLKRPRQRKSLGDYGQWAQLRDYLIVRTMYSLALRPLEALKIKLCEIDFAGQRIMINGNNNKVKRGRILKVPRPLLILISAYLHHPLTKKYMHTGYIFPTYYGSFISRHAWKKQFAEILKRARLWRDPLRTSHGHLTSYSLRHTRATQLYIETRDIEKVANFLGHTTYNATRVYIHLAKIMTGYLNEMQHDLERIDRRLAIPI